MIDQSENVKQLASEYFSDEEIILTLALDEVVKSEKWFVDAANAGRLETKSIVNKGIVKLAKQGSGPAQTLALKLSMKNTMKKIWDE